MVECPDRRRLQPVTFYVSCYRFNLVSHHQAKIIKHIKGREALYMYAYRKQQILIEEQQVNDTNDIFDLATIHPLHDAAT